VYVAYFNRERLHQGIDQAIPEQVVHNRAHPQGAGRVESIAVLGGLHHAYRYAT